MSRYKKMNPEVKGKWIKALRSGKFQQGRGLMKQEPSDWNGYGAPRYCCLGVLQELIEPENPYGRDGDVPTVSCLKKAGLGRYKDSSQGICRRLIDLNDSEKRSFREIADFIEKNL